MPTVSQRPLLQPFSLSYNIYMRKFASLLISILILFAAGTVPVFAQSNPGTLPTGEQEIDLEEATESAELESSPAPIPSPVPDLTKQTEETIGPLQEILASQDPGSPLLNPLKHAIRSAVAVGVPPNTIVLLLMLPAVAAIIAGARHLVGIRGFGIFLPAALSVVFLATGPVAGIGLFLVIVAVSTLARITLRKSKIKLQYLPRMALMLLFVVLGVLMVLFAAPVLRHPDITNVSIFPVLILVLLAEEFTKVQLGKSAKTAINLTTETLILALVSFIFITLEVVQHYALRNPEIFLLIVALVDILLGKFVGLRFIELWRFRKLISG